MSRRVTEAAPFVESDVGTDIHGYWELKTDDDIWVAFRGVNEGRYYRWFGVIAGIRSPTIPEESKIWHARGMPPNPSAAWQTYTLIADKNDFSWLHGHTWISYDEMQLANELYIQNANWSDDRELPEPLPTPDDEITQLYLAGARGKPTPLPWFGKLSELVPPSQMSDRLRLVVAFDS